MKTGWFGLAILLGAVSGAAQPPAPPQVRLELGVMIPMRDGVKLAADVWLPEAPGRYPVLLARTPYMKTGLGLNRWAYYFASRGYVFAIQDTRGRGDSEGTFEAFFGEGKDGYDTIEWLAGQAWSDGRVGMLGPSYLGTAQWLAARERPPHLACMAPTAAAGRWFEEFPYMGGAFTETIARSLGSTRSRDGSTRRPTWRTWIGPGSWPTGRSSPPTPRWGGRCRSVAIGSPIRPRVPTGTACALPRRTSPRSTFPL